MFSTGNEKVVTPDPFPGQQETPRSCRYSRHPQETLLIRPQVEPLKCSLLGPFEVFFVFVFSLIQDETNPLFVLGPIHKFHQVYKASITYSPIGKDEEKKEKGKRFTPETVRDSQARTK